MQQKYIHILIAPLLFLIILVSNSFAQNYFFKEYTEENGLPSGYVFDIAQDSVGRMWFATRNGIVSYDASRWNYFDNTKIFKNLNFVKLSVDQQGSVWAVNEANIKSLYYYKNEEWNEYKIPDDVSNVPFPINDFQICTQNKDTVIAVSGFNNNLLVYNKGIWNLHKVNKLQAKSIIYSLEIFETHILVFTSEGIFYYDRKTSQLISNYEKELNLDFIPYSIKINPKEEESLIALGKNKIVEIKNGYNKILVEGFDFPLDELQNRFYFLPEYSERIFFGNTKIMYEFEKNKNVLKVIDKEARQLKIGPISLFVDYENNLWIAGFRGLLKMLTPYIHTYKQSNGLFTNEVTSVLHRDGKYYFGHENGITIYNKVDYKHIKLIDNVESGKANRVLDMCLDENNNIWIAASDLGFGLLSENDKIEKWYKVNETEKVSYNSLIQIKGGALYASTIKSIYKFDGLNFNKLDIDVTGIRKLYSTVNNELVVGTIDNGIIIINNEDQISRIISSSSNLSNSIHSFWQDSLNTFVGTGEGLFTVDGDSLKKYKSNFVINRPIYFIKKDNQNHYWFGTDNGVFVTVDKDLFHITPQNGLLGYETNRDAGFIDENGRMWIGTDKGLSSICFNLLKNYQKITPKILFLVKVGDEFKPVSNIIEKDHDSRTTEFYVSTTSFINESNNKIYYQLRGISDEFNPIAQKAGPYISFLNLSSGTYSLSVFAENPLNLKSEIVKVAEVNINAPFYNSWWFSLIIILIAVIFIYVTIRYFERKRYAEILEEEVDQRTFQLSASEKKYENLLNRIQDAVFVIQDSKMIFVNEAFYNITGFSKEEVIDKPFAKFIAPEDLPLVVERYEKRVRGELVPAEYEIKLLHRNGFTRIYVNMHVGIFEYEGKTRTIGTLKDVTAFKLSQEKIVKSEARLRALTNMLPDMMFELDENGILLDYHLPDNSPILVHPLKLVGKNIKEFLPRSLYRFGMSMTKKALDTGRIQLGEFFIVRDNKKRYFEARVVVSSERKALVIIREITDRKESEKQLIIAKDKAEQSDKLKSEFLAQVSHEIRTPINTILNFASLIKEECEDKVDPELRSSFSVIENGGRRLIRTIDLILNMSQIQTDAYQPNFKMINIDDDVLSSVYYELRSFAESKNLTLNYEIDEGIKIIEGDSYTLGQIFVNLIDNAIKYTQTGSITIKSYSDEKHIFTQVIDTGIGISKEFIPSLFTPFSQEETGYTRKFEGTGLGLALVKNYVALNKGEISVQSKKGEGTAFTLKFNKADHSSL
ncbi:MAG: PAS domain S-box protein [Melioribacteraceae bacterium]|nr:PAS domain S-box protein [Melioribacteraceae bacterium]